MFSSGMSSLVVLLAIKTIASAITETKTANKPPFLISHWDIGDLLLFYDLFWWGKEVHGQLQ